MVDNASTDDTRQVLKDAVAANSHFLYLRVNQIGLGAARDAGWRQSRGSIVSFTHDNCYLAPDFVDAVVEVFRFYPDVGCSQRSVVRRPAALREAEGTEGCPPCKGRRRRNGQSKWRLASA